MKLDDDQFGSLLHALKKIVHGDSLGFMGLEGLSVAMAGEGLGAPVGEALYNIGEAIRDLADAVKAVADNMPE